MNVILIVAGILLVVVSLGLMLAAKLRALRELRRGGLSALVGGMGSALGDGLRAFGSGPADEDVLSAAGRGMTAMATKGAQVQEDAVRRFGPMERLYLFGRYGAIGGAVMLVVGIVLSFV